MCIWSTWWGPKSCLSYKYYTIPCTQMLKSSFCDRRWRKGDYCQVQSWKVREGKNLQNYSWLLALYISFVFINTKRKDLFFLAFANSHTILNFTLVFFFVSNIIHSRGIPFWMECSAGEADDRSSIQWILWSDF